MDRGASLIYPFTVIECKEVMPGHWGASIRYEKVVGYEPSQDPATQYRNPIIRKIECYYGVAADSEESALNEVAKRVLNS